MLVVASIFCLFPRTSRSASAARDGVMRDTDGDPGARSSCGLDLQGGMHLALELDQSKRVSADPDDGHRPRAHRAPQADRRVRRRPSRWSRRSGDDRIVVELAGIADPARAKAIVQQSAFLEFRITDKTGALEKALPAHGPGPAAGSASQPAAGAARSASAVTQLLGATPARQATAPAPTDAGPAASWAA